MTDFSLRIKFDNNSIEAHASDPETVAKMINQATKKFFGGLSVYLQEEIKLP